MTQTLGKDKTKTEFNSSIAVLMRLDKLIQMAHASYQGLFSIKFGLPKNDNEYYLSALERIYIEAYPQLMDEEKKTCNDHRNKIIKTTNKWINDIHRPVIIDDTGKRTTNIRYLKAWIEIKDIARHYELFLMQTMSDHGLLLTEKGLADQGIFD